MNSATHSRLASFIWSIADDVLRDLYVRGKYRDVYLQLLLTSVNHHLRRLVTVAGHGTRKLEKEGWGSLRLPIPPVEEQDRLINHVEEELCHAGLATRKLIGELLQEFKTRLTADVVTGQIDVRVIAATLPEIDPAEAAESVSADVDDELDEFASDALEDAEP